MRQRPPRQASLPSLRRAWPEAGGKFPSQSRGATLADAGGRSRCESGRERAPAVRVGALRVAGATAEGKVNCPGVSRGGTPADGGGRRFLKGARGQLAACTLPPAGSKGDASGFVPRGASSDIGGGEKGNYSRFPIDESSTLESWSGALSHSSPTPVQVLREIR